MSWRASAYIKALIVCPNGERISRTEKLVALVLADSHQDKGNAFTFPAVKMIAEDSLMDPRVCRRVLSSLERKGVVERERAENQGRGQLTFYRFPELDGKQSKGGHSVPLSRPEKEDNTSSLFLGKRRTEGGRKGDKTAPPYIEEQEQEPKQKPPLYPLASEGSEEPKKTNAAGETKSGAARIAAESPGMEPVDRLMDSLGITERRLRQRLGAVIAKACDMGPPDVAVDRMIAAYRKQGELQNRGLLKGVYGVMKFFERGIWRAEGRLLWDNQAVRLEGEARTGRKRD